MTDWTPTWLALTVPSQRERATREFLRAQGTYAFYPSREATRISFGKSSKVERPIVTGFVFAKFTEAPDWEYLKRVRRVITGVISRAGMPIEIHPDVIKHLQGMTVEHHKLQEARAEMLRVRPGDKARIIHGPLTGMIVEVSAVSNGEAWLNMVLGGRIKADLASMERIVDDA